MYMISFEYNFSSLSLILKVNQCTHVRHIGIRDFFARLLNEVCDDLVPVFRLCKMEPSKMEYRSFTLHLKELDMKTNGLFESRISWTHVSAVKVFSLYAKSCQRSVPDTYKYNETIKNLKYRIIEVEKAIPDRLSSHVHEQLLCVIKRRTLIDFQDQ